MTTLAFVVRILAVLVSGFVVFRALRFSDEVDEGRVRSDGIRRTDVATRRTFREPDPDAGILGHSPEEWERSTRKFEENR
jgi:hypothetical protein